MVRSSTSPYSTTSEVLDQEGLEILDSMLAGTATIEETVIMINNTLSCNSDDDQKKSKNKPRWSGRKIMCRGKAPLLIRQKCAGEKILRHHKLINV